MTALPIVNLSLPKSSRFVCEICGSPARFTCKETPVAFCTLEHFHQATWRGAAPTANEVLEAYQAAKEELPRWGWVGEAGGLGQAVLGWGNVGSQQPAGTWLVQKVAHCPFAHARWLLLPALNAWLGL